jgi:surface antigen
LTAPRTTWTAKLHRQIQSKLRLKTARRRNVRIALLASNVLILAVIIAFVALKPNAATPASLASSAAASTAANPLDQVSSADIALTVARLNSLPETTAINNQAQSQAAEVAIAASSNNVTAKPAVIATSLKSSADIKDYTVLPGDTVASIAAKFGVTSESIRWSNGLTGDTVAAGTKLAIPPVNGVVYTVNTGDTPDSLAAKFHVNKDKIIAYNDAEIKGLAVGQRIIIPDAVQGGSTNLRAATIGPSAFAWGTSPMYGANGYDYGYCTWYVANRIAVPNNWGNANTWSYYAPGSGWRVSKRPTPGSVAQTTGPGYGHVALVEAVSDDGTMIKYSDMNGLAGWGRVGTTNNWVPASHFNNYISR